MNKVVQISSFIKGLARKEIHVATGPLSTAAGAPLVCQFRGTDQLRVDETTGDYLIQPPAQSKVYKSRSHSALPSWVLNISKVRDSPAFQGKLHQCWPLRRIFFFLMCKEMSCILVCACCFLSWHWATLRRVWISAVYYFFISFIGHL